MKRECAALFMYLLIFSNSCNAIINGFEINENDTDAQHVVALQMPEKLDDGTTYYHKGTGIILSTRLIITAGHNIYYLPDPAQTEVIFSINPDWGNESSSEIRIKVKKAVVYPGFHQTEKGTEDDLAIVLLEKPIPPGYSPLPLANKSSWTPSIGSYAIAVGYGTNIDIASPPLNFFRLRKTVEPLFSYDGETFLKSKKIWFDQTTSGICGGDSGGPIIFKSYDTPTIYGIAIHVAPDRNGKMTCLTKGAFTNIVFYRGWIDRTSKELIKTT